MQGFTTVTVYKATETRSATNQVFQGAGIEAFALATPQDRFRASHRSLGEEQEVSVIGLGHLLCVSEYYDQRRYTDSVSEALMHQSTTLEYVSDTLSDLSIEVRTNHANDQRQRILDWLSEYPYEAQYRRGYQLHCFKTCRWLLEHPEFIKWSQRRSSLLWMHGQAGSGKTVTTSYLIHHLRHHLTAERHLLAYFYYDASTIESLTPETFFGAVVKQFCAQLPHIPDDVADAYKKAANRVGTPKQASQIELQRFLLELLREARAAIIVIDGLDETPDCGIVCDFLTSIVTSGHCPLRVFISSRPEVDLRRRLGRFQEIAVQESATEDDISVYVQSRINHDHRLRHMSDKMKRRVEFSLRADCHGM